MATWQTWRAATTGALYGPEGFYRRPEGPGAHFRTSSHVSPLFARALAVLARSAGVGTVVDVGAGRGELLAALSSVAPGLRLVGVEVAPRPDELAAEIEWHSEMPDGVDGLVVANEWLDNVPVDVAEVTDDGVRVMLVDVPSGDERPGPSPSPSDHAWLRQWWPLDAASSGHRAEIGWPRDDAWADVVSRVRRGVLVTVDYAHTRAERVSGCVSHGTLAGYRAGRAVRPVPDGSCDITSHVALDACAAAGERAGATATSLLSQREALRALGVGISLPPRDLALSNPRDYLAQLVSASESAELVARDGLGSFTWLVQAVGCELPADLVVGVDAS